MSSATTRGVRRHGDGPLVRALATLPAMTYLVVLMVVPLGLVIAYAFLTAGRFGGVQGPVTLDNVTRMLEPLYRAVLASSILNAGTATLIAFLLGFPAVLPIYASLQRLDPQVLEAARNLGAGPWRRFRTVLLPLTLPGIITGCLFVFIPSLGNFVIPELLGGGNSQMIGNVIRDQFLKSRDWPFGSALSLMVLALLVIIVMFQASAARRTRRWGA